jgi:hypothetical protein
MIFLRNCNGVMIVMNNENIPGKEASEIKYLPGKLPGLFNLNCWLARRYHERVEGDDYSANGCWVLSRSGSEITIHPYPKHDVVNVNAPGAGLSFEDLSCDAVVENAGNVEFYTASKKDYANVHVKRCDGNVVGYTAHLYVDSCGGKVRTSKAGDVEVGNAKKVRVDESYSAKVLNCEGDATFWYSELVCIHSIGGEAYFAGVGKVILGASLDEDSEFQVEKVTANIQYFHGKAGKLSFGKNVLGVYTENEFHVDEVEILAPLEGDFDFSKLVIKDDYTIKDGADVSGEIIQQLEDAKQRYKDIKN